MPIYEFECNSCGYIFEDLVKYNQDHEFCPKCNEYSKKIISRASFHLKGGGWADTGYDKTNNIDSNNTMTENIMRIPECVDKNTGATFMGTPEIRKVKNDAV